MGQSPFELLLSKTAVLLSIPGAPLRCQGAAQRGVPAGADERRHGGHQQADHLARRLAEAATEHLRETCHHQVVQAEEGGLRKGRSSAVPENKSSGGGAKSIRGIWKVGGLRSKV